MFDRFRSNVAAVREIVRLLNEMYNISHPTRQPDWNPDLVRSKLAEVRRIQSDHADSRLVQGTINFCNISGLEEAVNA